MKRQKIVYICSPLRGDLAGNIIKANYYSRFAYEQGCIPLAPHAIFTQFLDDNNPNERKSGMTMGLNLLDRCDELWAFGPNISDGMKREIEHARRKGIPIRYLSESMEAE